MGAAQVIAAFVGSPEYKAQKHSKEDTVRCLYRVMLGREADEQGLDTWAAALYGGKPVMKVIEGLGLTDKFFALCEEYGVDPGLIRGESPMPGTNALKTKALVSGIYKGLLGRNADKAGLENWAGKLLTGKASALQVVAGIMGSQEFKNRKLTNSQTVEDLYEAMLGRKPDAAGLKTWKAKLDAGYSVNTVINGIAGSKEFIGICKECGITVGKLPEGEKPVGPVSEYTNEEKVKAFVEHTYQAVFGRKGDEKGIADHTQMILKGRLTPDKLIRSFINSSEFKGKNLSSEETVKALYRAYLYREADGDGLKQWVNKLEGGTTLDEVMKGFAGSNEFKAILKGMK